MKIKTRLLLSFTLIIILFLVIGFLSIFQTVNTHRELRMIDKQYSRSEKINYAVRNILLCQNILTEMSLTGESDNLAEAEKLKDKADQLLTQVLKDVIAEDNDSAQTALSSILQQLQVFYSKGVTMSNAFAKGNTKSGIPKMRVFFVESEIIQSLSDRFISVIDDEVTNLFASIMDKNMFYMKLSISVVAVTILLALFLTFSTTSFIVKPVLMMVDVSKNIAAGVLTSSVDYEKSNELGALGSNLNHAVESLRKNISDIAKASDATIKVKDELAASTEETSSAVTEIASNNVSMKNQIVDLDKHILNSSGSITQIDSNIQNLVELIDNQSLMVNEATEAVNRIISSINNVADISQSKKESTRLLVETSSTGGEKLSITNSIIMEVSDRIGDIQDMMEIINTIASQTNLLSMNAAIEAAHAGDAGKGFAVVADEIRKLAESTAENAKNISSVIVSITESIESASRAGMDTQKAFDDIQHEVSATEQALDEISVSTKELAAGGGEILKTMDRLTGISEEIKSGAMEMKEESGVVAEAMTNVQHISGSVTIGMEEITRGIEEISGAMNDLNNMTLNLGENSDSLNEIVKQFEV